MTHMISLQLLASACLAVRVGKCIAVFRKKTSQMRALDAACCILLSCHQTSVQNSKNKQLQSGDTVRLDKRCSGARQECCKETLGPKIMHTSLVLCLLMPGAATFQTHTAHQMNATPSHDNNSQPSSDVAMKCTPPLYNTIMYGRATDHLSTALQ
jgi:hypothetical protein